LPKDKTFGKCGRCNKDRIKDTSPLHHNSLLFGNQSNVNTVTVFSYCQLLFIWNTVHTLALISTSCWKLAPVAIRHSLLVVLCQDSDTSLERVFHPGKGTQGTLCIYMSLRLP